MLRKREGLPPFTCLQDDLYVTRKLTLIATSAALCPRQPDWGGNIQVCGFLNPPGGADNWKMPPGLQRFIESGAPPVYFTFGSCTHFDLESSTRLFLETARKAGVRAIVQSNWESLAFLEEHPNVYRVSSIPHEHVFPHCSMIVHHGGSGTSQSSLRAGKPSVVVAHAFDQPYWGKKLMQLGVAGKVLQRRKTTSDVLAKSVLSVLDSPQLVYNAQKAKQVMDKENGVDNAVALINQTLLTEPSGRAMRPKPE
jgi:UDP:flavonoid glycosyltransferase YjiC (YdhE family)